MSLSTPTNLLFNAAPRAAYQAGAYTGFYSYADLLKQGDFGLGATDENNGELLLLNGAVYRSRINGTTNLPSPDEKTPFATVTFFRPTESFSYENMSMEDFEKKFDLEHSPKNRIYAIRITGSFTFVEAGAGAKQAKPYRPLAEVFKEYVIGRKAQLTGDLVGFRCPSLLTGIDYVGFHFHFIDQAKDWGGHVFDFGIERVEVAVQELSGYSVVMPPAHDVLDLDLESFR
jgi:acetolactate decarboxylase